MAGEADPSPATGPDGSGGPHAFVIDIDEPELSDDDFHHLARSLRLRTGDPMTVSDGAGRWRPCRFDRRPAPIGAVIDVPDPAPVLTLALALTKGSKPELVVQKLTELGVDRIVLFHSSRSVSRWDPGKAQRQLSRLQRIAREAAMQSRRVRLPALSMLDGFPEAAGLPGAVLADSRGGRLGMQHHTVLIGPEGGWAPEELAGSSAFRVALGAQVLRAETAAIAAATLMAYFRQYPG